MVKNFKEFLSHYLPAQSGEMFDIKWKKWDSIVD